ncbi:hypothetical protein ACPPVT_10015 [Angustibacter sp. McL0619]|uniref:hypothetical protein n=1 Tax=Angustibacter sp. McL0619 TaxID=3415676 RepID=UPI003CE99E17
MPLVHPRQLPSSAEVARTLLEGLGSASLAGPLGDAHAVPALHAALGCGDLVLAVPRDSRSRTVAAAPGPGSPTANDDWAVSLCVRAEAALPDLTVPRAHLEVLGWARYPGPADVQPAQDALRRAWPLDSLEAYDLLLVEVAEGELHWVGGCVTVDGDDVRSADPDPLWLDEADLLDRIRALLSPRLLALVQGLGRLPLPDGRGVELDQTLEARPVAVDRYGLTVQCRDPQDRRHLLRLPFGRPIGAEEDAWASISTEIVSQAGCRSSARASATAQDASQPLEP